MVSTKLACENVGNLETIQRCCFDKKNNNTAWGPIVKNFPTFHPLVGYIVTNHRFLENVIYK